MIKTTIYIPDELKVELRRVARETGRSEADVVRDGIRLAIQHCTPPTPQSDVFRSGGLRLSERVDELLEGYGEH